jgi:hypothetical protein
MRGPSPRLSGFGRAGGLRPRMTVSFLLHRRRVLLLAALRRGDRLKVRDHRTRIERREWWRHEAADAAGDVHRDRRRFETASGKAHREIVLGRRHADGTRRHAALAPRGAGFGSRRCRLEFDRNRWRSRKETGTASNGKARHRDGDHGTHDRSLVRASTIIPHRSTSNSGVRWSAAFPGRRWSQWLPVASSHSRRIPRKA